jgi:hypothetical protein
MPMHPTAGSVSFIYLLRRRQPPARRRVIAALGVYLNSDASK